MLGKIKTMRARSPSHAAKNKTPADRVREFGRVLGVRNSRLLCRPCNLALDHTRRSTIVEHLRSRKHRRFLYEVGLPDAPATPPPSSEPAPSPSQAPTTTHTVLSTVVTPAVLFVDADDPLSQDGQPRTSPTAGTSGLVGPYLLKKEAHCSTVLDQLMRDETFTDVTLTAEGQSLRAHRIVLCLASPYFRQVLSRELTVQSVVVLRDIKFSELRNIIHFIYTGEATVDASELESFMRTAELLEIASLCEGQKSTSSRGPVSQNSYSSGFTIGDFERLVGTKRTKKETSPTPSKVRRLSGEGHSSRSSSAEPTATINPLSLIKEEPDCDNLFNDKSVKGINENPDTLMEEAHESERTRRDSGESVGGFAAIAGVQKSSSTDERTDDFSSLADSSPVPPVDDSAGQSPAASLPDTTAAPGRCPYCPHLVQKFEGVAMMRHLLVSHPCKPAFPCDSCWRVFVKRSYFKSHKQKCQQPHC